MKVEEKKEEHLCVVGIGSAKKADRDNALNQDGLCVCVCMCEEVGEVYVKEKPNTAIPWV